MSDTYDPLAEGPDDEIEEVDEVDEEAEGAEGDGDSDEESEEASGAADGDGQEASGTSEGSVRQPSRGERRIQAALKAAREANERAERAERLVTEATRTRQEQNRETVEQRRDRLAMMDPDDRVQYLLHEQGQKFEGELAAIRFQTADSADRTAFEGLCARNPAAGKLKAQVETYLADMRRNGTNAPRETVLRYVIGDRALANAGKATGKAQRRADDNRVRQQARPGAARSDTGGESRRGGSEAQQRAKRLEDIEI